MKVNEVFQDDEPNDDPDVLHDERAAALSIEYEYLFQLIREVVWKMIENGTLITKEELHKSGQGGSWQRFDELPEFGFTQNPMLMGYAKNEKLAKWLQGKLHRLRRVNNQITLGLNPT
jgi:hypothetical protein